MKHPATAGALPRRLSLAGFVQKRRNTIVEVIAALFILLFVYTALSKLFDFGTFKHFLKASPLIGNKSLFVAWTLPEAELIISLLLFIPRTRRLGLWCSLIIMTLFTLYLGYMIAFVPDLPCNCGGVLKQMSWSQHLLFNIFFTALAAAGLWLHRKSGNAT